MAKDDEIRAGAVILKDLALFNKAAIFFEEQIDPAIRMAITECVTAWIEEHGWKGEPDVSDDFIDMWLNPASWEENEDEPLAKFKFGYRANVETTSYQIADLFGVGQSDFGFRFEAEHGKLQGKTAWNTYAKTLGDRVQQLHALGWLHEGKGVFFRPATLPASLLVTAWENEDWTETLVPLKQALEALVAAQSVFDTILNEAKPTKE